jgi:hypothetical protein
VGKSKSDISRQGEKSQTNAFTEIGGLVYQLNRSAKGENPATQPRTVVRFESAVVIELRFHLEALNDDGVSRTDLVTILRGQLTVILKRAESGVPVSVEAIARAERLARTLEATEVSL